MQKSLIATLFLCSIVLFGLFTQFPSFSMANDQAIPKLKQSATPSEDLVIDIVQNASAIGQFSKINFTITLVNNGSTTMYDLNTTVNTTSSNVELTPTSSFSHSSLAVNQTLMYEINLGILEPDAIQSHVDVVLIIDGSGSMGGEISSVQDQLNNIVNVLETEIPNLRIGVIVYGWSKYSEYPMSSANNYVELTSNFDDVKDLINELYAGGGTEPWGDALYLANTWDWRDTASKLIIMVGDEDCDPGQVVGKNHEEDWYNGSQLLDVVTDLKEKEVMINTVVTEDPDSHVEHQFQWIADYTEGESVYLPDLEQAADPITLPELIQEWTLERSREYSHWLFINTTWSDGASAFFTNSAKVNFWMDLAAPSIIHYERVIKKAGGLHDVQILAEVRDISEITSVILYHNAPGSWAVEQMLYDNSSELYTVTLHGMPEGYNLTFFIEASDVLKNSGTSSEYWMIIETVTRSLGETAAILLSSDELETSLFKPLSSMSVYLWMFCEPAFDINVNLTKTTDPSSVITPEFDRILDLGNESRTTLLFKFSLSTGDYLLTIAASEAISEPLTIRYSWLTTISLANQSVTNSMSENIRKHMYRWTLHEEWYLMVDYTPYSDLVVYGDVFYENWTYIGNITVSNAVQLQPGSYYVLVQGVLRTGEYGLILTDDPDSIYDEYYDMSPFKTTVSASAPGLFFTLFSLFVIVLVFMRKKRKRE